MFCCFAMEVSCINDVGRCKIIHAIILVISHMNKRNQPPNFFYGRNKIWKAKAEAVDNVDPICARYVVGNKGVAGCAIHILNIVEISVFAERMGKRIISVNEPNDASLNEGRNECRNNILFA